MGASPTIAPHQVQNHHVPAGALFGATLPGPASAPLRPSRQTTHGLPARAQFDAWRDTNAGLVEYQTPSTKPDSYEVSATTWCFGGLALLAAETPAGIYRRSAASVRRDGLDLWSFSVATHGQRVYRTRDRVVVMRPGELLLHSLAQPFETARTRSGWLHLYVPRKDLPAAAAATSGCELLETAGGRLLRDHLLLLAQELPRMTVADGERMAEATRALIALAVAPSTAASREEAAEPAAAVQMVRLRELIRAHLGAATLDPTRLCRMAGISRSQLYRLFEPHGGVALFIQRERLNAAHRALSDASDRRGISEIAESVGLFDPSSFSRMFRRSFGVTPRELRMARTAGALCTSPRQPGIRGHAGSFAELLRAI